MIEVQNRQMIDDYYKKYQINQFFETTIKEEMRLLEFTRNEHLCKQGEEMAYLMLFVEGHAKTYITLPNGKSLLVSFYSPLQIIGDVEVMNESVASCTIEALTKSYALGIPMKIAINQLSEDKAFLKAVGIYLGEKLESITTNSAINLLYPLENRLASYINTVAVLMQSPLSREYLIFDENLIQVAELLGTSYRHLLRSLNSLCQKGILKKEGKGYEIINRAQLDQIAKDIYEQVHFL